MGEIINVPAGSVTVKMLDGCRIGVHVRTRGSFEPETLAVWSQCCQENEWAIDVGSYTGLYAIAAAKLGAKALAIEPMPDQQKRIEENVALNKVEVELGRYALGRYDGSAMIAYNPAVPLTSGASLIAASVPNAAFLPVAVRRLDGIALDGRVSVIKVDVERGEDFALLGAQNLLYEHHPTLLVECLNASQLEKVRAVIGYYHYRGRLDQRNAWFN